MVKLVTFSELSLCHETANYIDLIISDKKAVTGTTPITGLCPPQSVMNLYNSNSMNEELLSVIGDNLNSLKRSDSILSAIELIRYYIRKYRMVNIAYFESDIPLFWLSFLTQIFSANEIYVEWEGDISVRI